VSSIFINSIITKHPGETLAVRAPSEIEDLKSIGLIENLSGLSGLPVNHYFTISPFHYFISDTGSTESVYGVQ